LKSEKVYLGKIKGRLGAALCMHPSFLTILHPLITIKSKSVFQNKTKFRPGKRLRKQRSPHEGERVQTSINGPVEKIFGY